MKTLSLLIFVILLCPILAEKSYGQTTETTSSTATTIFDIGTQKIQNNTEIFIQIKLYDSSGRFVGYTEGHPQIISHLDVLIKATAPNAHTSTIIKQGKTFEVMQVENPIKWPTLQAMGGYFSSVSQNGTIVGYLTFSFDSFPISPGDTTKVVMTIIRSAS
jgi:hypothetical protein